MILINGDFMQTTINIMVLFVFISATCFFTVSSKASQGFYHDNKN